MKKSFILNALLIAAISASVSLASPVFGKSADESDSSDATDSVTQSSTTSGNSDEGSSVELLNKAHGLLVKFTSSGSDPDRKKLLVRARKLIAEVAPDETLYHGARKEASEDILAALKEIKQDNPDEKVIADHIRRANDELRSAISLGAKAASNS